MKKLIMSVIAALMLLGVGCIPAFAEGRVLDVFTANISTYPITEVATMATQLVDPYVHHILISNSDATIAQTVSFYELSDSTTTVSEKWSVDLASTSASGYVEPIQIPFPIAASPWFVEDLSIRKSDILSDVRVTIFYR